MATQISDRAWKILLKPDPRKDVIILMDEVKLVKILNKLSSLSKGADEQTDKHLWGIGCDIANAITPKGTVAMLDGKDVSKIEVENGNYGS